MIRVSRWLGWKSASASSTRTGTMRSGVFVTCEIILWEIDVNNENGRGTIGMEIGQLNSFWREQRKWKWNVKLFLTGTMFSVWPSSFRCQNCETTRLFRGWCRWDYNLLFMFIREKIVNWFRGSSDCSQGCAGDKNVNYENFNYSSKFSKFELWTTN